MRKGEKEEVQKKEQGAEQPGLSPSVQTGSVQFLPFWCFPILVIIIVYA
jgi:hypothetical protein